ncbi:MAG: DUF523 domain-containing protein [Erysipelotrichia bacterium]|nr:DUF523 domain-containing protein [Erysipelotrichia bacterium]NCC54048.1 DUF523 domain-containing protein [Erysipelotrichia bacterium]
MLEKVLVSACLLGEKCRYDKKSCPQKTVIEYVKDKQVFPVCPEAMGGLAIPRTSCEIVNEQVLNAQGIDYTKEYVLGAKKVLKIAQKEHIQTAILKSKSPSCGVGEIYDGTFSGKLKEGNGICAQILMKHGINVINSDEIAFKTKKDKKKPL